MFPISRVRLGYLSSMYPKKGFAMWKNKANCKEGKKEWNTEKKRAIASWAILATTLSTGMTAMISCMEEKEMIDF